MLGDPRDILKRRSLALAVAPLIAAAFGAFLLFSNGSGTAKAGTVEPSYARYPALNRTEPSDLPIVTVGDTAPAGVSGPVFPANPSPGLVSHGPVPASIKNLPIALSDVSAWIAKSADGGICVLASSHEAVHGTHGLGMSCVPTALMESGTYLESDSPETSVVSIVGVVPSTITAVKLKLTDGTTRTVQVVGNAWALETMSAHIETISNVSGG